MLIPWIAAAIAALGLVEEGSAAPGPDATRFETRRFLRNGD